MERTLKIFNIGKHKSLDLDLSKGQTFAFMGKNGSGKSTIIRCLETIFSAKGFIEKPVTDKEEKGQVVYEGTDTSGNPIKIEWDVKDGDKTGSFKASSIIDGKLKTISSVTKIRELMGVYIPISAQVALSMMRNSQGRTNFIESYILPSLPDKARLRLNEIDIAVSSKKNNQTQGNLYHTRTQLKNKLIHFEGILSAQKLTEEDKILIAKQDAVQKGLKTLKERETVLKNTDDESGKMHSMINLSEVLKTSVHILSGDDLGDDIYTAIKYLNDKLISLIEDKKKEVNELKNELEHISTQLENGNVMAGNIATLIQRQQQFDESNKKVKEIFKDITDTEEKIENLRKEKKKIIAESELPTGLAFEDDTITFNDMPFDETVVSQTETQMAMIELMMLISKSELINIGDWSLYDTNKKKELIAMAEKQKRLLVGQLVTDDDEITMKIIINE